ncbi:hypothetical protein PYW07_009754 [Mythimna separata]|uniref:Uncharacterized protein n=1 Tax=Mythimna separata TaxID=271217 RepID=A0AAD8DMJ5_MYTSE|nr:hypothetical protein PYW07_009754 [Mythimna separata]
MAAFPATLVLFLYFALASGYTLLRDDDNEIIWPSEYHFKGEKLDFALTTKSTFEIWYSAELNRSRIDINDGTQQMWYYGDTGHYYERHPITNLEVTNEEVCSDWRTGGEQVDFLPDTSDLTYTGQSTTLNDKVVDIWTGSIIYGDKTVTEITLYVFKTDSGVDIPVQEIRKEINYDKGQLSGQTITNYFDFTDEITEEELTVDNEDECEEDDYGKDFHKDIRHFHHAVPAHVDFAFELYTNHHSKVYHDQEYQMRKRIFENNWKMIEEHNRKNLSYRMELNTFSDKTPEELRHLTGTRVSKKRHQVSMPFPHSVQEIDELVKELPENFDLRIEGDDTPVKNQGSCGSCWAFCTTAAVEGALARVNGERLLDLSEQSLVDCSWGYENDGCGGGTLDGAMKYVYEHGIPTEMEYGLYTAADGYCKIQNMSSTYNIRGFSAVTPRNPNALKVTLFKYGPATVAIYASRRFTQYSSGVFYDLECEGEEYPNHCVTVVGYGVRDGEEYWLIKNSYGETWGEDGYILMSAKNNNCLVLDSPYYPVV